MDFWISNYVVCLLLAVFITGMVIPKILLIAFRRNLFDDVNERKIHRGVIPRLGGIAFVPTILFSCFLVLGVGLRLDLSTVQSALDKSFVSMMFLVCALLLMFLVGIADDLIGVRYRAKFIFQIICGFLLVGSGMWIHNLYGFLGIGEWGVIPGSLMTIFLIIYVTNAINLIDGIDGLASGVSMIAFIFYSYLYLQAGEYVMGIICGASVGTLMTFFYYNVFGKSQNHTKIFMGDAGSLTIGLLLSFMSIGVFDIDTVSLPYGENAMILAIAPILLPCLDVVRVFFHRIRRGHNPFLPDKCHIHHKLLALGLVQWQALIIILITDSVFIICNLLLSSVFNATIIVAADIVVWTLMNMLLTHTIRGREKSEGKNLYE